MRHRFLATLMISVFVSLTASADEVVEERRLYGLAFDRMIEGQTRIMGIVDRIRIAGADLCGKKISPVIGVFAIDHRTIDDMYPRESVKPFVDAIMDRYELGREPRVLAVVQGLPAAEAGLRPGDLVKAVDGKVVKKRVYLDVLRGRGHDGTVTLDVERDGVRESLELEARMGCSIPSRFAFGPQVNAFAIRFGLITGIYFYSGILRLLPDDDELAIVVGHELAHMVLNHNGIRRTSKRYEADADYLGIYLAARAGFDVSKAPGVWDSFARQNPYASIDWGFYSHPTSATRSLELRAAIAEIEQKQAAGLPLEPESGSYRLDRPDVDEATLEAHQETLRIDALKLMRSEQTRIQNVSYRLAIAGREECGEHISPVLGATVGRVQDFMRLNRKEAEAAFGVTNDVTVFAVASGSPAALAGILSQDRILEIDGDRIKRSKHVFEKMRDSTAGSLAFRIGRGDEIIEVSVPREIGCQHGTFVFPGSSADTGYHTNKLEITVPTGLVRFADDDDELAIAIAHQYGHQLLGRMRKTENEPKADAIGLRIARSAGYDISKAPGFWDRYAAEQFWKISGDIGDDYVAHGAMAMRSELIRDSLLEAVGEREAAPAE